MLSIILLAWVIYRLPTQVILVSEWVENISCFTCPDGYSKRYHIVCTLFSDRNLNITFVKCVSVKQQAENKTTVCGDMNVFLL